MKLSKLCCFLLVGAMAVCALAYKKDPSFLNAMRNGGLARIVLRVVDDESSPVADTKVRVFMGMNFRERGYWLEGTTDTNGVLVVEGKTTGNEIEINLSKDGYYDSKKKLCFIKMGEEYDVMEDKWQPFPMEKRVELRRIRDAIPLTSFGGVYYIPVTNEWASFDMVLNDWTPPYGHGKTPDVEFYFSWKGQKLLEWEEKQLGVRFPGSPFNGGYLNKMVCESQFPYSYRAKAGETFCHEFSDSSCRGERRFGMLDGTELVFRIRSVTNSVGQLQSCLYGRFQRLDYGLERTGLGSLLMRYFLNPTPNDTNLEDDELYQRYKRLRDR